MLSSILLLTLLLPLQGLEPSHTSSRGNVLIVVADDVGVDQVGAYGEGSLPPSTPRIDALAHEGVMFRNAWSQPVCSPTRAALLTGRHAFRTGIGYIVDASEDNLALPMSEITLPEMLALGTGGKYASAAFGKWHLGNDAVGSALAPNLAGFDHFDGALSNFYAPESYTQWTRVVDGVAIESSDYATSKTVDQALAWLATAPEPWLCYVAFNAPHAPLHAPPAALHTVDLAAAGPPATDPVPYYRAMVEALDTEFGRLLDGFGPALQSRTTVVFVGDNGTPAEATSWPFAADHAKGTLYEGGINVPLIVAGPQVATAGESDALVGLTDVYATVADVADVDLSQALPGVVLDSVSLLPYMHDPRTPSIRKTVLAELFHPNGQPAAVPAVGQDKPVAWECQVDIGYGSPGGPVLGLCGPPLYGGNTASLQLTGAPPLVPGLLFTSNLWAPLAAAGGLLVPSVVEQAYAVMTDEAGEHVTPLKGGTGEATWYYQIAVLAPGKTPPFKLSNALQVSMHGTDLKAIRDVRFKLIMNAHTGAQQFYDLENDPFERADLLQTGPLDAPAKMHLKTLQHELMQLLWNPGRPAVQVTGAGDP